MKKYRAFVDTLGIHATNVVILRLLEMEHVKNVIAVALQQGAQQARVGAELHLLPQRL